MAIIDVLKSIAGVLQEAGKIEQYQQILDAQKELLVMQKQISYLEMEDKKLKEENKELKEKLETKESLVSENNAYWIDKDGKKDGPFCTCCWDDDKKTIRMQPDCNPAYYYCPKCKNKSVEIYPEKNIYNRNFNQDQNFFDR